MKLLNRVTPLLLALLFSLTACENTAAAVSGVPETQGQFTDIPSGAPYITAVTWCVEQGLMNGVGAGRFDPNGTLNRSMLATVLYRAEGQPAVDGAPAFTDTKADSWYSDAVVWANEEGLLMGYGGGFFGTADPVSQEQLKVVMDRYMGRGNTWVGDPSLAGAATRQEVAQALYENLAEQAPVISNITTLAPGLFSVEFTGDDGLEDFLAGGGAGSDAAVAQFLSKRMNTAVTLSGSPFGCSTLVVKGEDGGAIFGRNFDWNTCDAMVVTSKPSRGYASISTVNLNFLRQVTGSLSGDAQVFAALYAPLDGMNEKGLAVSVNMIQDTAAINQNTGKDGITTTTAIRLMLNKAATVDEALRLLEQYDLHGSFGMMIHFAIADNSGRGVAVEYINNEIVVTETPVVTNFYLAEGSKQGIGTQQSHTRFDTLTKALSDHAAMTMDDVRDALDSVSKHNFGSGESTEWSAVFHLATGEVHYYHREDYATRYTFHLNERR